MELVQSITLILHTILSQWSLIRWSVGFLSVEWRAHLQRHLLNPGSSLQSLGITQKNIHTYTSSPWLETWHRYQCSRWFCFRVWKLLMYTISLGGTLDRWEPRLNERFLYHSRARTWHRHYMGPAQGCGKPLNTGLKFSHGEPEPVIRTSVTQSGAWIPNLTSLYFSS